VEVGSRPDMEGLIQLLAEAIGRIDHSLDLGRG
jgi:hypothetical protein